MTAPESFLGGRVVLHAGDCRAVVAGLADNSVDAVATDPPYALVSIGRRFGQDGAAPCKVPDGGSGVYARASAGFMGQRWDTGEVAFDPTFWADVLRVLRPGGHLVAFGGTRTYHRLACAIEDAGFEIRDCIVWHYGSGFPKSHNISKTLRDQEARCACDEGLLGLRDRMDAEEPRSGGPESDVWASLREGADRSEGNRPPVSIQSEDHNQLCSLRYVEDCPAGLVEEGQASDLLTSVQRSTSRRGVGEARAQGVGGAEEPSGSEGAKERVLEGRRDLPQTTGQLCERPLCEVPAGPSHDGEGGRLRDGASAGDGEARSAAARPRRVRPSSRPRSAEQHADQSGTLARQSESQARGAWPLCRGCGKPIVPDGLGTALKPATELIVLARKPLVGTVAETVLRHGTGALNVDGCRIHAEDAKGGAYTVKRLKPGATLNKTGGSWRPEEGGVEYRGEMKPGRWPANLVHDGSEEVLERFPEAKGMASGGRREGLDSRPGYSGSLGNAGESIARGDAGSAARFFYCAKADAEDRLGSKHPTVKPVALIQWLCRLVTPPGGTVLDPFAGTGTTGEAAIREGFRAVLIEREPAYRDDIRRRMAYALGGPEERAHAVRRAKGEVQPVDTLPLFADGAA